MRMRKRAITCLQCERSYDQRHLQTRNRSLPHPHLLVLLSFVKTVSRIGTTSGMNAGYRSAQVCPESCTRRLYPTPVLFRCCAWQRGCSVEVEGDGWEPGCRILRGSVCPAVWYS